MPGSPLADFGSVGSGAGCGVARKVTAPGRPARANKEKKQRLRRGRVRGVRPGERRRDARQADFGSVRSAAGCEVARKVGSAVRSARPIKKKAAFAAGEGAGCPAGWAVPESPLGQFWQRWRRGRARGCPQCAGRRKRKGYGDARCAPARQGWAGAAGARRDGRATIPCGGSRGPADPWSAAAASKRRDLWFFQS